MTLAAVGRSELKDAVAAAREATGLALERLLQQDPERRDAPRFALVFATAAYDQDALLRTVGEVADTEAISGCSAEGVIADRGSREQDHAVAVLLVSSSTVEFEPLLVEDYEAAPAERGAELAARLSAREPPRALLVFPDGLRGNCTDFLDALGRELDAPVAVVGATSADAMAFDQTYQYRGTRAATDAVAAVAVRGAAEVEVAVSHGCTPIGLERTVTEADGGWVQRIDGRPAWDVFREYLHGDPDDLSAVAVVHLCIGLPLAGELVSSYAPHVLRTPMRLDKDSGALLFPGGGIEAGQAIRLTRRDPLRIRESAVASAAAIRDRHPGRSPALVLQFDCAGRGKLLFGAQTAENIVEPLVDTLGADVAWIGFHTYGEIAPIGGRSYYHNYTVALFALYDMEVGARDDG